jgi:hypothetical protein
MRLALLRMGQLGLSILYNLKKTFITFKERAMKFHKILFNIFLVCTLSFAISCGGSGTSSTSTDSTTVSTAPEFSTLGELPTANSEVEATSSSLKKGGLYLATTGMPYGTTNESNFDQDSSQAACETFSMSREAIIMAGEGGTIQCYIQQIFTAIQNSTSSDAAVVALQAIDIYDGEPHTFDLVFDDDLDGGPEKIRIETDKNADGVITQFKMDACNGDGEVNETIVQTINPATGAFDSNITHVYSDTNEGFSFTGSSQVDVDGTVNGNGNFEGTKEIIMSYTQSWTAGSNEGEDNGSMTLNQQATGGSLTAWMTGSNFFGGAEFTFTNKAASFFQLIDGSGAADYTPGTLALGDGAALVSSSGGMVGDCSFGAGFCDDWEFSEVQSWLGDTTAEVESNDFTATAAAATLPTPTTVTVSITSDFDCSAATEGTIDMSAIFDSEAAAETVFESCEGGVDRGDWINCYVVSGDGYDEDAIEADGGGSEGGGDQSIDLSTCDGVEDSDDASSVNIGIMCGCYEIGDSECSQIESLCSGSANMGECATTANENDPN